MGFENFRKRTCGQLDLGSLREAQPELGNAFYSSLAMCLSLSKLVQTGLKAFYRSLLNLKVKDYNNITNLKMKAIEGMQPQIYEKERRLSIVQSKTLQFEKCAIESR